MEARPLPGAAPGVRLCLIVSLALGALAEAAPQAHEASFRRQAGYRTRNFVVQAPTAALAREIGDHAEKLRDELAIEWIGQTMPAWGEPCPITAQVAPQLGAGGATSFVFDRGQVYGWEMNIQGSRERVLDSVLPHEITHTVFASYFRKPLPRWADEGACTTVEHHTEIAKQEARLVRYLKTGQGIPFTRMFAMKEYPPAILPLYAQGHSLTQYLIEGHGKQAFLAFLADGMADENWTRAIREHYGQESLYALQSDWLDWVKQGRPRLDGVDTPEPGIVVASTATPTPRTPATPVASVYTPRRSAGDTPSRASVYDASRPTPSAWR